MVFKFFSFYNACITSANIMIKRCCDDATHSIETFQKDQRLLKISVDYFESIINRIFLDSNFEKVFQWFSYLSVALTIRWTEVHSQKIHSMSHKISINWDYFNFCHKFSFSLFWVISKREDFTVIQTSQFSVIFLRSSSS